MVQGLDKTNNRQQASEYGPLPFDLGSGVLGNIAKDSAMACGGLCALPATTLAESSFLAAKEPPRLIKGLLNNWVPTTALQEAKIGITFSG